ncbi:hypothetical protein A1O3_02671 [Capronia epimyces CBS 606.96]|uniref:NADPH--cytochrome P450 reductase n=1 Tax=Capronia epimyces CBS 606.96 TaxID=1182542 RepID=W9Z535_9EURO|nr:uncharacterized protein A1O3_02671 [Capronia epimyces CBS 606.96]EXJ89604.1 hypothetical protein A1O3_02671 [Capronia epimyces CBS 606.96]
MVSSSAFALPNLEISQVHQLFAIASLDDLFLLAVLLLGGAAYLSNGVLWNKPDPYHYKWFERPQAAAVGLLAANTQTRDIALRLEETGKQAVIFWGSQSGTAEGFAHRLAHDLHRRLQLEALVADVSDYDEDTIAKIPASNPAIFIMATYGEGDPSDNSGHFVQWLKSNPEDVSFGTLKFAAFGCGNSNYKYYNAVVDAVVASLQSLGAALFMPVGKADEARATTEEDFLEWKTALFAQLCAQFGLSEREPEYEPSISVVFDDSIDISGVYVGEPLAPRGKKLSLKTPSTPTVLMPVVASRELTTHGSAQSQGQRRSCLHLELDFADLPEIKYKTGDHLAVQPVNPSREVMLLLNVLALSDQADTPIMIQTMDSTADQTRLPSPTTLRALFQHYLEICGPVSRETVLSLARFAPTDTAKSYLVNIASEKASYAEFIARYHVTLSRLLQHVTAAVDPSVDWKALPLSFVIESLRPMMPRYYSISSSSIISPRRAAITVANNPSILAHDSQTTIPGLASTYLSSFVAPQDVPAHDVQIIAAGDVGDAMEAKDLVAYPPIISSSSNSTSRTALYASIRRSTFKLPASPATPLILVAAGTGIAPFRGFLHERARLASIQLSQGRPIGRILLFFGCRHPDLDLLYKDELVDLQQNSALKEHLEVVFAFSRYDGDKSAVDSDTSFPAREQNPKTKRIYVQDKITQRSADVVKLLLDEDAALYICGSASMAREVGVQVGEALRREKGTDMDDTALRRWREDRKRVKRWQEDVW